MANLPAEDMLRDLKLMREPLNWPAWPLLPLINRKDRRVGVLVGDGSTIVFVGNMHDVKFDSPQTLKDSLGAMPRETYASLTILATDWRVD